MPRIHPDTLKVLPGLDDINRSILDARMHIQRQRFEYTVNPDGFRESNTPNTYLVRIWGKVQKYLDNPELDKSARQEIVMLFLDLQSLHEEIRRFCDIDEWMEVALKNLNLEYRELVGYEERQLIEA